MAEEDDLLEAKKRGIDIRLRNPAEAEADVAQAGQGTINLPGVDVRPPGIPAPPPGFVPHGVDTLAPPAERPPAAPAGFQLAEFKGGGGDFRGDATPAPEAPEPPPGFTYNDIRDYPADYSQMVGEGVESMAKGAKQFKEGKVFRGAGNAALGALEYTTAPIQAGIRSAVGRPVEKRTGIPKQYTEFATALALPGYGLAPIKALAATPEAKAAARVLKQMFVPEAVSPTAERAAGLIREKSGTAARDTMATEKAFSSDPSQGFFGNWFGNFEKQVNQMKPQDQLGLLGYIEGRSKGVTIPDLNLQAVADVFRDAMQSRAQKIGATKSTMHTQMLDDYATHYWVDPIKAKAFIASWTGKQGSTATLKQRSIPTIADGIAAGLQPVTTNPVEIAMRYVENMDKVIAANQVIDTARKLKDVKYFKRGSRNIPLGWVPLKGRLSEKLTPAGPMQAHAPEDWALVYNNYISQGVHAWAPGGKAYDAYMRASNNTTALLLGLSGYHAFTMATEGFLSSLANGVSQIYTSIPKLDPKMLTSGVKDIVTAPAAPVSLAVKGKQVQNVYLKKTPGTPDMQKIVGLLEKAGGRAAGSKHAQDYQFSQRGSYFKAWRRGAIKTEILTDLKDIRGRPIAGTAKAVTNHIGRIMATIAGPLFDHYIPLMKNGAFYETMATWLKANPTASREQSLAAARKIWDSVDNRLGETVQDNIFWNKVAKQAAQASLLSYSWNLGTFREIGGGTLNLVRSRTKALDLTSKEYSPTAAYVVAFPAGIAAVHSLYQYLKTGDLPDSVQDLMAPMTGGMAPPLGGEYEPRLTKKGTVYKSDAGRPPALPVDERALLPGYQKDVFGWYMHPGQEASNKVAPLAKILWHTAQNANWAGKPIVNFQEPPPMWLERYLQFVQESIQPITMQQIGKMPNPDSNISLAEKLTGVRAAPAYLQDPEGYKRFEHYREGKAWQERMRFEDPDKYKLRAEEAAKRRAKNKEIKDKLRYQGPQ